MGRLQVLYLLVVAGLCRGDDFVPQNSQKEGDEPPAAAAVLETIEVGDGFEVRLFAAEPDVRQPVSMAFDDRGRLWVAECYSYGEYARQGEDRVVVFEDTDGDGRQDRRTVFWDKANHLTSVVVGFGGVWMLDLPELWFIPDADGDLVPDGPPVKKLDGFTLKAKHNMANGLSWGPDGWLYGRHGILGESKSVGPPGAPAEERDAMWCGMWRYHPVEERFEVVFRGMTNGWGHDWDAHGHLFVSGNVNGHLWHGIPGAYYERMHGSGHNPHVYGRLTMIGEKPHYPADAADWKRVWNKGDVGRSAENTFGGGHSHAGLVVYQGDNWPAEFRGEAFMCNTHGRRMNRDSIERKGSGFTSRYLGDVMTVGSPWFRGSAMALGPEGAVYVADWVDLGECHDNDGVHRTSGRIYRVAFGAPERTIPGGDLGRLSDEALVDLQRAESVWHSRRARRILQERAAGGGISGEASRRLRAMQASGEDEALRLRALWGLWVTGQEVELEALLDKGGEHERCQAVQLMVERGGGVERLVKLAEEERSGLVRVYLASALQKLPPRERVRVALPLVRRSWGRDELLENVLWYGIEPTVVMDDGAVGVRYFMESDSAKLRARIARRLASEGDGELLGALFGQANRRNGVAVGSQSVLRGALEALRGRKGLVAPEGWNDVKVRWYDAGGETAAMVTELAVLYGDDGVVRRQQAAVRNPEVAPDVRVRALRVLVGAGVEGLRELLVEAFGDAALRKEAIVGLQRVGGGVFPDTVLGAWGSLGAEERVLAVEGLVTRKAWARDLLEAIGEGTVARTEITPSLAQRVVALKDEGLRKLLNDHWGVARTSSAEKKATMERFRKLLTDEYLAKADLEKGEQVFGMVCGACHALFGKGGTIGPDLTGGGRKELDYVLENVVDPSASVPQDYWLTFVTLKDGRVLAGTVAGETTQMLLLQTAAGEQRVDKGEVAKKERTFGSTMPEGLLESLSDEQVRDLVAYLRK